MTEKVVGILGGMGPEATVNFLGRIVALTPAHRDQDHLRIIIDNNPKIPDRTEGILAGDRSLFPVLLATARNLEKAGADFIVIPCNTVHHFYQDLVREVSVPVLHMVEEVARAISASLPGCRRVGLLATTGTVVTNLYQKIFDEREIEIIVPDASSQARVMEAILKVKGSQSDISVKKEIVRVGNSLIERGAEALILGCTDIPLVVGVGDFPVPVFDSADILAAATVKFARADMEVPVPENGAD